MKKKKQIHKPPRERIEILKEAYEKEWQVFLKLVRLVNNDIECQLANNDKARGVNSREGLRVAIKLVKSLRKRSIDIDRYNKHTNFKRVIKQYDQNMGHDKIQIVVQEEAPEKVIADISEQYDILMGYVGEKTEENDLFHDD